MRFHPSSNLFYFPAPPLKNTPPFVGKLYMISLFPPFSVFFSKNWKSFPFLLNWKTVFFLSPCNPFLAGTSSLSFSAKTTFRFSPPPLRPPPSRIEYLPPPFLPSQRRPSPLFYLREREKGGPFSERNRGGGIALSLATSQRVGPFLSPSPFQPFFVPFGGKGLSLVLSRGGEKKQFSVGKEANRSTCFPLAGPFRYAVSYFRPLPIRMKKFGPDSPSLPFSSRSGLSPPLMVIEVPVAFLRSPQI